MSLSLRACASALALLLTAAGAVLGARDDAPDIRPDAVTVAPTHAVATLAPASLVARTPAGKPTEEEREKAREAARRKGKKTGLGSSREKPEVITEELMHALIKRKVDVRRFLDPDLALFDIVDMQSADESIPSTSWEAHRCGDARERLRIFFRKMARHEVNISGVEVSCDSTFALSPEAGLHEAADMEGKPELPRLKHITCRLPAGGEYGEGFWVEWMPDAKRGWRIAALALIDGGSHVPGTWEKVARAIDKPRRCQPPKRASR